MRHPRGVLRQRLDTTQRLCEREELRAREEGVRRVRAAADAERDHAAVRERAVLRLAHGAPAAGVDEAARVRRELLVRECVARMACEAGVGDGLDLRVLCERAGDGERVRAVRLHAQVQRLRAALREPAVEGARHCSDCVLQEAQAFREGGVVRGQDERAHDDVRVPVDVFRERVEDDVGAEEERGLVVWREEGVVYEDDWVRGVGTREAGNAGDVDKAEGWVCR